MGGNRNRNSHCDRENTMILTFCLQLKRVIVTNFSLLIAMVKRNGILNINDTEI